MITKLIMRLIIMHMQSKPNTLLLLIMIMIIMILLIMHSIWHPGTPPGEGQPVDHAYIYIYMYTHLVIAMYTYYI